MDIKLSQPNNEFFSDPDLPVTLVVAKEDELGVEVLQLNRNKTDLPSQSSNQNRERLRLLRKKYEQQAPFRYFCNQCSFKTKRHSHMKTHSRLHEKVCTIYSCDQCDFSTIRASHLKRHIVSHEKEVFSCPDCQYITHEKKLFNKHQRYKHIVSKKSVKSARKNTYQCLHCNYTTTSEKTFQRHMTVHAQKKGRDKPSCFKCNHCSYQTPSRSNYSRHLSGHAGERPFMCTTCGLCFKRSDTLVQHQATHITKEGKEGAFTCPECQKCFRSNTVLKEHMLTHGDEQRYLCEICAASFKTRDNQRRHYNQKHVHDKENICPTCSKTFSSRYILKRHMKLHEQKKPTTNKSDAQKKKISDLPQAITNQSPKEWCNLQTAADSVQVIVVHQESSQSELTVQEGPLFQVASSLIPGQTLSVPVIPIEYVIPTSQAEVNTNSGGPVISVTPSSKEEIIALTFVQEDSEFIGHNQAST
ncbi:hypothetical protein ONE63_005977 [Megalurothrips usitatus]|uniref:C2H2-type domain-containing protein n=1 Tax=Megalurothrips usitatus TaxID=439358 RepID=A0AAV7XSM9_9NEOP|nr:hypothetical protein ONE63_005977 [Megalurothrips usitatus]